MYQTWFRCPQPPPPSKVIVLGHARSMTRGAGGGVLEGASERVSPGVAVQEYSVLVPSSVSAKLWSALSESPSVLVAGEQEWQTLRIRQGKEEPSSFVYPSRGRANRNQRRGSVHGEISERSRQWEETQFITPQTKLFFCRARRSAGWCWAGGGEFEPGDDIVLLAGVFVVTVTRILSLAPCTPLRSCVCCRELCCVFGRPMCFWRPIVWLGLVWYIDADVCAAMVRSCDEERTDSKTTVIMI